MALTLTYPKGGALVTGGTGSVGEGIARHLADAGVPLVFTHLGKRDKAQALEREFTEAGQDVAACQMDMTDADSIRAALHRVVERYGRLHTVACGSGVPVSFNRLADFELVEVERFLWGDALGNYRIFRSAIPLMRAGGGGSITTCTTMATRRYILFDGLSPLSKGSVEALARQTTAEEASHGIRSNEVAIGWVRATPMEEFRAMLADIPASEPVTQQARLMALLRQIVDIVPMGRPATLAEAGNLFAFLASDQAAYVTGQSIALDGGATI